MAAALAACKILREVSHLDTEAKEGHSTCQTTYEQLALGKPGLASDRPHGRGPGWPVGSSQEGPVAGQW